MQNVRNKNLHFVYSLLLLLPLYYYTTVTILPNLPVFTFSDSSVNAFTFPFRLIGSALVESEAGPVSLRLVIKCRQAVLIDVTLRP